MKRQILTSFFLIIVFYSVFLGVPVKIRTIPGNASVYINNILYGITDRSGVFAEMMFLMEGDYVFKAEKPGYNTLEKMIPISEATSICLEMIPSGVLSVKVFPVDSDIFVDEEMKAIGVFEEELPVGKHFIQISNEGYITRTFYLDVKQYSKRELQVTLEKEGKTKIISDPLGALVSIDGNKIGKTPIEIYLDAGKHIISFHKEWYYSETKGIEIEKEGLNEITQILKPFSNLTLEASPSETMITLNSSKTSRSPLKLKKLNPGKYQVKYSLDGYKTLEKELYLEIGENDYFEELTLKEYPWEFSSTPAAVIRIDGEEIGLSPLVYKISHGEHLIHYSSAEKEWMTKINVFKTGELNVNLNQQTTIVFNIIPAGQSFVVHKGIEYESPAIINTTSGLQTFDILRSGYPSRRRLFKLLPGKIYEQTINLEGESELFLISKPAGATVFWMGSNIGNTPLRGIRVRPGSGMLRLEWVDGASYEEIFSFLDGETYTIYRDIPSYTELTVNSLPSHLEIFLDGKLSGETPVVLHLKQGTYTIRCKTETGEMKEKVITLYGEKERTVNFVF